MRWIQKDEFYSILTKRKLGNSEKFLWWLSVFLWSFSIASAFAPWHYLIVPTDTPSLSHISLVLYRDFKPYSFLEDVPCVRKHTLIESHGRVQKPVWSFGWYADATHRNSPFNVSCRWTFVLSLFITVTENWYVPLYGAVNVALETLKPLPTLSKMRSNGMISSLANVTSLLFLTKKYTSEILKEWKYQKTDSKLTLSKISDEMKCKNNVNNIQLSNRAPDKTFFCYSSPVYYRSQAPPPPTISGDPSLILLPEVQLCWIRIG